MHYNHQHMYELCKNHMHSYVLIDVNDGTQVDGIITGLDNEYVYVAVPIGGENRPAPQDFPPHGPPELGGFGYGFFGGYPGYGYGYGYRPRRFRRLILPLAALTALSVLPWY